MVQPVLSTVHNPDGTVTTSVTHELGSVNWAALFQAVVAAAPALLSILSALTGANIPPLPFPKPNVVPPSPPPVAHSSSE